MLKKTLMGLFLAGVIVSSQVQGAEAPKNGQTRKDDHPNAALKDAIMKEDQIDPTDVFTIPLDESEVEDDLLIDRLEGRKPIPEVLEQHSRSQPNR